MEPSLPLLVQQIDATEHRFDAIDAKLNALEKQACVKEGTCPSYRLANMARATSTATHSSSSQEVDEPLAFYQDEGGREFVKLNEQGDELTYGRGSPDFWTVRSKQSFSSGVHYVEVEVLRMQDEGNFGITSNLDMVGNRHHLQDLEGVMYYAGRRYKRGDMRDGVACVKVDTLPKFRMFHVADGNVVGICIDCDRRLVRFYLDSIFQGEVPWPDTCKGPVYVCITPDEVDDKFRIRKNAIPYEPFGFQSWGKWFVNSLVGRMPQHGDVVTFQGRSAIIHYGPDLQGDMQVMFNEVYPDYFPISGDLNKADPGLSVGRCSTTIVMLLIILCFGACPVFLVMACWDAFTSTQVLRDNVPFKANVLFFTFSIGVGLYSLMIKAPNADWKKRFLRSIQTVPTSLMLVSILWFGPEEEDLQCNAEQWGPMIPAIAQLYAPKGVNVMKVRQELQHATTLLPLVPTPSLLVPTMAKKIPSHELHLRSGYFGVEILFLVLLTCAVVEVFRRFLTEYMGSKREVDQGNAEPLLSGDATSSSRLVATATPRCLSPSFWRISVFLLWYLLYQAFIYFIMDIMVMCGAVNLTTGPAWEFWILFIQFVCVTHLFTALIRYAGSIGVAQKKPAFMIWATLMPFFGNEVHIFKDHVAGAICFAVAHCSQHELRTVAFTLAYASLAATFVPLPVLFLDKNARHGLRKAHWPIIEASEPEPAHSKGEVDLVKNRGVVASGQLTPSSEEVEKEFTIQNSSAWRSFRKEGGMGSFFSEHSMAAEAKLQVTDAKGIVIEAPKDRPTVDSRVIVLRGRSPGCFGTIVQDDKDSQPFQLQLDSEEERCAQWYREDDVQNEIDLASAQFPVTLKCTLTIHGHNLENFERKRFGYLTEMVGSGVETTDGNCYSNVWKVNLVGGSMVLVPEDKIGFCTDAKISEVSGRWTKAYFLWCRGKQYALQHTREFTDIIIPAVTLEKQLRAFIGEVPHGILHVSFIFYFGGSVFILCAMAISAFKVLAIPVIREVLLPDLIPKAGCSVAALKTYHANTQHIFLFTKEKEIFACFDKFGWGQIQRDLEGAGMPSDASDVASALKAAAKTGNGKALREMFQAFAQDTQYVLADAVGAGDVEAVKALVECGFDLYGAYSFDEINDGRATSLDTIISQIHGMNDSKGFVKLNDTGKQMMKAVGRTIHDDEGYEKD